MGPDPSSADRTRRRDRSADAGDGRSEGSTSRSLLVRLKADDATRDIPVIALTAHAMAGDRDKALEVGCDDYDTKPVELARLLAKAQALLDRKAQRGDHG